MLIEMASCDVSAATLENLGQGLFGVQLEVTEKLLEAEKKKLTQLELQLDEETRHGISSVEKVSLSYVAYITTEYIHV